MEQEATLRKEIQFYEDMLRRMQARGDSWYSCEGLKQQIDLLKEKYRDYQILQQTNSKYVPVWKAEYPMFSPDSMRAGPSMFLDDPPTPKEPKPKRIKADANFLRFLTHHEKETTD